MVEAEELSVQVIETRKKVLGLKHPFILTSIPNLAHVEVSELERRGHLIDRKVLLATEADLWPSLS